MGIKDLTDEEIVARLKGLASKRPEFRDQEAQYFEELFKRYSNQTYSFCRYYGLRRDDANDAVQESFILLDRKIHLFDENRRFKPYYFQLVMNVIRDKYRKFKREKVYPIDNISEDKEINKSPAFDEILQNQDMLQRIIDKVPKKLRDILTLKLYADMDFESIAETTGISVRSAYNYYDQALDIIKAEMGEIQ